MVSSEVFEKIQKIKMLVCDLDGVLTDGRIWMSADGQWRRTFCVYDGVGIKRLRSAGYQVGIITMSDAEDVRQRATYLDIDHFYEGVLEKETHFKNLLQKTGLQAFQVAYMGDDLMDLPILKECGLAVSVPNGMDEIKAVADHITKRAGGFGAVREVCDLLLSSK